MRREIERAKGAHAAGREVQDKARKEAAAARKEARAI